MLVVCFLFLAPVLNSGYIYDDTVLSSMHGNYVEGMGESSNSLEYWGNLQKNLFESQGRFLLLATFYFPVHEFASFFESPIIVYKSYLVFITLTNVLLFGCVVFRLTDSKKIKLIAMLIFPVFFQLSVYYFNPYIAFGGLLQVTFLFGMGAILFLQKNISVPKFSYALISVILFLCSLLTYEISFMFFVAIIAVVAVQKKGFKKKILALAPYIAVTAIILIITYIGRENKTTEGYDGISIVVNDPMVVATTYAKQTVSTLPLSYPMFYSDVYKKALESFNLSISVFEISGGVLFCLIAYFIIVKEKIENVFKKHQIKSVLALGLCMLFITPAFVAVSEKYQVYVDFGTPYLPVYFQFYGLALIVIAIIMMAKRKLPNLSGKIPFLICIFVCIPIMIINSVSANLLFASVKNINKLTRHSMEQAIKDGFFTAQNKLVYGAIPEEISIINMSAERWTAPDSSIFSAYAKKPIKAEIIGIESSIGSFENAIANINGNIDYAKHLYFELKDPTLTNSIAFAKGSLVDYKYTGEETLPNQVFVTNAKLYVLTQNIGEDFDIIYNAYSKDLESASQKTARIGQNSEYTAKNGDEERLIYAFEDEIIDINSIKIMTALIKENALIYEKSIVISPTDSMNVLSYLVQLEDKTNYGVSFSARTKSGEELLNIDLYGENYDDPIRERVFALNETEQLCIGAFYSGTSIPKEAYLRIFTPNTEEIEISDFALYKIE